MFKHQEIKGHCVVKDASKSNIVYRSQSNKKRLDFNSKRYVIIINSSFKVITTCAKIAQGTMLFLLSLTLVACEKTPPDYRPEVTLPAYTQGDADNGKLLFKDYCSQCHQLTPGLNKKGPQLMNIYGAPAALLKDYQYSQALQSKDWVWDVKTLDPYIADPKKVLSETKMLSDPIPNTEERADIIAYLSTLRAPVPVPVEEAK